MKGESQIDMGCCVTTHKRKVGSNIQGRRARAQAGIRCEPSNAASCKAWSNRFTLMETGPACCQRTRTHAHISRVLILVVGNVE
jgi:hypothetical protein